MKTLTVVCMILSGILIMMTGLNASLNHENQVLSGEEAIKVLTSIPGALEINITPQGIRAKLNMEILESSNISVDITASDLEEDQPDDIMDISLEELLNVNISLRGVSTVGKMPMTIIIINHEDIIKRGYTDLEELIRTTVPSVYIFNDQLGPVMGAEGGGSTNHLRNFKILVNNIEYLEPIFNLNTLPPLDIHSVERVEIVLGPMPSLYGNNAVIGVISIITVPKKRNGTLSISGGSYGMKKASASVAGGNRADFSYAGNFSVMDIDGEKTIGNELEPALRKNYYADMTINSNQFNASALYSRIVERIVLSLPKAVEAHRQFFSLNMAYTIQAQDLSLQLEGGFNESGVEFDNSNWLFPGYQGFENDESRWLNLKATVSYNLNAHLFLVGGLDYQHYYKWSIHFTHPLFSYGFRNWIQESQDPVRYGGLFLQAQYEIKKILFIGGIRGEKLLSSYRINQKYDPGFDWPQAENNLPDQYITRRYNYTDWEWFPEVAFVYRFSDNFILKGGFATAKNTPSFFQIGGNLVDHLRTPASDLPPLIPETVYRWYLEGNTNISNWLLSLRFRTNLYEDIILRTLSILPGGSVLSVNSNTGKYQTTGLDFMFHKNFQFGVEIIGSLSIQNSKNKSSSTPMPYAPNIIGKLSLSYSPLCCLHFTTNLTYLGGMEAAFDPVQSIQIGEKTPDSALVNANIYWKINKHIGLNLHIANVFDYKARYPTTPWNNWNPRGSEEPGRKLIATVDYNW